MSRIIATAAIRGAHKLVERAEETLAKAIEQKGKDQKVEYPDTAYFLPIMLMLLLVTVTVPMSRSTFLGVLLRASSRKVNFAATESSPPALRNPALTFSMRFFSLFSLLTGFSARGNVCPGIAMEYSLLNFVRSLPR